MRIAITGAAGFLGSRLARALLAAPRVAVGGRQEQLDELVLLDLVPAADDILADARVVLATGDLGGLLDRAAGCDVVVHLAAVVSADAERDLDLGLRANVDLTRGLLESCRRSGRRPVFVFASSLAVFGGEPQAPMPRVVGDDTLPRPQSSYGVAKLIAELLVGEYTRRSLVRGRTVRLMTVAVRPGRPNAAASSFVSGIIREPLAGLPAVCPVDPDTEIALASPRRAEAGLLAAIGADDETWGPRSAVTLPALTVTSRSMASALDRVTGSDLSRLIQWSPDPAVAAIVGGWPARFETHRATALGLAPDPDFGSVIRAYLEDERTTHG